MKPAAADEPLRAKFRRFLLVGSLATGIQYLIMFAAVEAAGMPPVWASGIGFVVASIANYLLSRRYTFRSAAAHGSASLKYALVVGLGLLLNLGLMQALTAGSGLPYILAQVLTTGVVLVWNFLGNAWWSFAK